MTYRSAIEMTNPLQSNAVLAQYPNVEVIHSWFRAGQEVNFVKSDGQLKFLVNLRGRVHLSRLPSIDLPTEKLVEFILKCEIDVDPDGERSYDMDKVSLKSMINCLSGTKLYGPRGKLKEVMKSTLREVRINSVWEQVRKFRLSNPPMWGSRPMNDDDDVWLACIMFPRFAESNASSLLK